MDTKKLIQTNSIMDKHIFDNTIETVNDIGHPSNLSICIPMVSKYIQYVTAKYYDIPYITTEKGSYGVDGMLRMSGLSNTDVKAVVVKPVNGARSLGVYRISFDTIKLMMGKLKMDETYISYRSLAFNRADKADRDIILEEEKSKCFSLPDLIGSHNRYVVQPNLYFIEEYRIIVTLHGRTYITGRDQSVREISTGYKVYKKNRHHKNLNDIVAKVLKMMNDINIPVLSVDIGMEMNRSKFHVIEFSGEYSLTKYVVDDMYNNIFIDSNLSYRKLYKKLIKKKRLL